MKRILIIIVISFALVGSLSYIGFSMWAKGKPNKENVEGETEEINDIVITHHFAEAAGLKWHYIEAGDSTKETIVFVHGVPDSWYGWLNQILALADDYHVIAIDMKGFGQSDKKIDGMNTDAEIAQQTAKLFDVIGIKSYYLVGHDWGTAITDVIAATNTEKVLKYVRIEGAGLEVDLGRTKQLVKLRDPKEGVKLLSKARLLVQKAYSKLTVQEVPKEAIDHAIGEFSRKGTAGAVQQYYIGLDVSEENIDEIIQNKKDNFAKMTMPVLLLQAESDPLQPIDSLEGLKEAFPDAKLQIVKGSGHFPQQECPDVVTIAIVSFIE